MKLSAELADIVGKKEASRAECIKQLWAYIKKNNLQDPENKQFFNPDKKMADFRQRQDPCLRHGQVLERPPFINRSQPICLYIIHLSPKLHPSSLSSSKLFEAMRSRFISCSFPSSPRASWLRGAGVTQPVRYRRPQLACHRTLPRLTHANSVR